MAEIWLLIALAILIAAVYKPLSKMITGALDGHSSKVKAELDEAKQLREEAQSMLADYQRRLAAAEEQAKSIVEHAGTEVERQTERQRVELEASLRRRTEQAMDRIAMEEARALAEVRGHAATLAIRATERLLAKELNGAPAQALLNDAIEEVGRKLS